MATNLIELQEVYDSKIDDLISSDDSSDLSLLKKNTMDLVDIELGRDLYITNKFDKKTIDRVFNGESESLQVKKFLNISECNRIVKEFINHDQVYKEIVDPNPPIYSIGSHLYSAKPETIQEDYFNTLPLSNKILSEILNGEDFLSDMLKKVAKNLGLNFERINDGMGRFPEYGSLRMWGWGGSVESGNAKFVALPHEDLLDISNRFPNLDIAKANNVYAAILCLSTGENPSKTVIWDKIPTVEDDLDSSKKKDYVFLPDVIEGVDSYSLQLHAGDLGIFPAHKIHAVIGDSQRCTLSCFFHIHDGKLIFRT